MKRFLLTILLWALWGVSPSFAQQEVRPCFIAGYTQNGLPTCVPGIQASASVAINIAAATTTQLVALVASQAIYITSFDFMAAGNNNVNLVYGTGAACATGQVTLTGAYPLIAQAGIAAGSGAGTILYVPQGNALCITTSGTGQLSGSVSYVQF